MQDIPCFQQITLLIKILKCSPTGKTRTMHKKFYQDRMKNSWEERILRDD